LALGASSTISWIPGSVRSQTSFQPKKQRV
jgi:hypothetical protein